MLGWVLFSIVRGTYIEVRLEQLLNVPFPMLLTDGEMPIEIILEQPSKAYSPILVMYGMYIDVRLVQFEYLYIILYQRFTR